MDEKIRTPGSTKKEKEAQVTRSIRRSGRVLALQSLYEADMTGHEAGHCARTIVDMEKPDPESGEIC